MCEPDELERSLEESALGEEGEVEVRPEDSDDAAGSAPGIAQVLSDPLEPGESLPIGGEVPRDARVVVRAEADGKVVESIFEDAKIPSGAEVEIERRPRDEAPVAVIITPSGERVGPTDVDEVTTDEGRG